MDLHEQGIFSGDAARGKQFPDLYAAGFKSRCDHPGAEGGRFNKCPIDFFGCCQQSTTDDHPRQISIRQDAAIPVPPAKRRQAALSGLNRSAFPSGRRCNPLFFSGFRALFLREKISRLIAYVLQRV
jgi:hypothetical protein